MRRGSHRVLDAVSFSLATPSLTALVGPNGAGKSTLLQALVGLIPRLSGELRLDGVALDARDVRQRLALMPQRSEIAWHFPITVRDLVALGRLSAARHGCCDVEAALQRVGLASLADRRLDQLSGGQQQRALLARTLVQQGSVLLLDEPCAAIDPPTRTALLQVMGQLRDAGLTLLVSSHDWGSDLDAYDQVLVLDHTLLAAGPRRPCARPLAICASPPMPAAEPVSSVLSPLWWLTPLLLALLTGLLCPLVGTLLLVQRRLFQANLISHAVLPGLAVAVALGIEPSLGGALSGIAGALLSERLSPGESSRSLEGGHEAVLNTVLAGFLGLGVLLIPLLHIRVDLEAVLFGDLLAATPLDLLRGALALAAVLALLLLRYDALVFLGVDPGGALGAGLPVRRLRLLLTLVTAFTIVSAMTAVGVVLVIGLMGAPAQLALQGATSLHQALLRSSLLGLLISTAGFGLALHPAINLPPGPLIGVLCVGLLPLARLREARNRS